MGKVSGDVVVVLAVEDDAVFTSGDMAMKRKSIQSRMSLVA